MVKVWKKLGERRYGFLKRCSQTFGNYDPENLSMVAEELTEKEYNILYKYLEWMHLNGKRQGWGNYEERYAEWVATLNGGEL